MIKELIERLREAAEFLGGHYGEFMSQAADALESKAAPVGERLVVTVVDPDCRTTTEHVITERDVILLWNRIDTLERQQSRELLQDLLDLAVDAVEHHRLAYAGYKQERQARMDSTIAEAIALLANDEG